MMTKNEHFWLQVVGRLRARIAGDWTGTRIVHDPAPGASTFPRGFRTVKEVSAEATAVLRATAEEERFAEADGWTIECASGTRDLSIVTLLAVDPTGRRRDLLELAGETDGFR